MDAERILEELGGMFSALGHAAEAGAARARRATDPILRGRWLAVAASRLEHRERIARRIVGLGGPPPARPGKGGEARGDLPSLLRADLGTSHAMAARARRVARLSIALGDAETAALCERLAAEALGHAAELARSLALLYAREARSVAN